MSKDFSPENHDTGHVSLPVTKIDATGKKTFLPNRQVVDMGTIDTAHAIFNGDTSEIVPRYVGRH